MRCICTYFPRLEWELGDMNYAVVMDQLQKKAAYREIDFCEVIAYSEESAMELVDHETKAYERNILVLTDSPLMAQHCADWRIPYGVVLCKKNQGDSFPQGAYCMEDLTEIECDYLERIYQRGCDLPWKITETSRLLIREITKADVQRIYDLYADEEITKYMEALFPTLQEEEEYTEKYIQNVYHFYGYGIWVLVEKKSGKIIGRAGLEYHDDFDGLELGFMLGKEYWHKGFALEACEAILEYGEEELEQDEYRALVHIDNEASKRLCEKLGFVATGQVDLDGTCHIDYRRCRGE